MHSQTRQTFLEKAEDRLAGIRGSLLLFAQGRLSADELAQADRRLDELRAEAIARGLNVVAGLAADCSGSIEILAAADSSMQERHVNRSLDLLSRLEAELCEMPLNSDAFLADVNDMVDSSFESFKSLRGEPVPEIVAIKEEEFEIDDETIEIFRSEAEGLLANISTNLKILTASPDDTNALWEIRRNAHTFKGAAGIIGFREASELAHRIEDLLDKMVESHCGADGRVIDILTVSTARLDDMTDGKHINEDAKTTAALYADFDSLIASVPARRPEVAGTDQTPTVAISGTAPTDPTPAPAPVVRVSLDRLDELIKLSRSLLVNQTALATQCSELGSDADPFVELKKLIEKQGRFSDEMFEKLQRIRMVRFGTLEMRFNRAVHVTCQEEGKKAFVVVENPDVEIDTRIIDVLIEPLLHILKNAVVHGIEPPETRRLLGKSEKGCVCITIGSENDEVYLSVEDDGRGISSSRLIEKAIASGILSAEAAASADEASILNLIFHRGLSTANSLNLNAGRGIGMSIVKESIENKGGFVTVESKPQQGTIFTIRLPILLPDPAEPFPEPETAGTEPTAELPPLVLIVDDSESIRRITTKIVEDTGCRTITAVNGAEALELLLCGAWEPDLILSDVEMPVMNGWEFLEYVKTDDNFGHIPVVMVTSLDSDEYRDKAFGLGASDYLVKPFRVAELDRVLEDLGKLESA